MCVKCYKSAGKFSASVSNVLSSPLLERIRMSVFKSLGFSCILGLGLDINFNSFFYFLIKLIKAHQRWHGKMESLPLTAIKRIDRAARRQVYGGRVCVLRQVDAARRLCAHFARLPAAARCRRRLRASSLASPAHGALVTRRRNAGMSARCSARFERDAVVLGSTGRYSRVQDPGTLAGTACGFACSSPRPDTVDDSLHGSGKYSSTLPIHRDTWASNIMQQINVWMPLRKSTQGERWPSTQLFRHARAKLFGNMGL